MKLLFTLSIVFASVWIARAGDTAQKQSTPVPPPNSQKTAKSIDVRGFPAGTEVMDPYSHKVLGTVHFDGTLKTEEVSESEYELAAAHIETLWASNIGKYCMDYYHFIMGLPVVKHPEYLPLLEKCVCAVVEKEEPKSDTAPNASSEVILGVQSRAVMLLLSTARQVNATGKDRIRYAALSNAFIGRLRHEIIPDFMPKPVFANVVPPISSGPMAAGMSPDAIKDPVARAAYLKAIEENSNNAVLNSRQHSLSQLIPELDSQLSSFLIDTKSKYPDFKDQVDKLSADKQP